MKALVVLLCFLGLGSCAVAASPRARDYAAMRLVIMHEGIFSTGDNEGSSEAPQALLRTLGDTRYAAFVISQRRDVQDAALAVFPDQIPAFVRKFPKTSRLYHARFSR